MDFFGIGPLEVFLVLLIGFLLFGPKRLFEMSRQAGKTMRDLSRHASDLSTQMESELSGKEPEKPAAEKNKIGDPADG